MSISLTDLEKAAKYDWAATSWNNVIHLTVRWSGITLCNATVVEIVSQGEVESRERNLCHYCKRHGN